MAQVNIVNNKNGYSFKMRFVGPFRSSKKQGVTSFPLPNGEAENLLLFRLTGQEEGVSFSFVLTTSTSDLSDVGSGSTAPAGDFPSGVLSLSEQIQYLRDYVFSEEFDADWSVSEGSTFYPGGSISGVITNLDIVQDEGAASFATGTFDFLRGNLGGV